MRCPHCSHELTEDQVRKLNAQANAGRRWKKSPSAPMDPPIQPKLAEFHFRPEVNQALTDLADLPMSQRLRQFRNTR